MKKARSDYQCHSRYVKLTILFFFISIFLSAQLLAQSSYTKDKSSSRTPVNEWKWIDSMTEQPIEHDDINFYTEEIEQTIIDEQNTSESDELYNTDINFIRCGPNTNAGIEYEIYTIGEQTQSITARRYITPFMMNAYETSYRIWYTVRTLSEDIGYVYMNPGQQGSQGRRGFEPTESGMYEPVTTISWYDIIVWCNAASELSGRTPCYTYNGLTLRDATDTLSCDMAECDWDADGYRLPSESEWEYAARKTVSGYQRGDLPSGSINVYGESDDSVNEGNIAWFDGNSTGAHTVGTAGSLIENSLPGSGNANGCGFFDMSGNVMEYCWDWFADYEESFSGARATGADIGSERIGRGGSWSPYSGYITCGDRK